MLDKQAIDIPFAEGIDTKTDPKRVAIGKFASLENTIFQKGGLLQKRNGYGSATSLPDTSYTYLTTFNNNLTAIGKNIAAYSNASDSFVTKGQIQPLSVATLPLLRNNLNQTACDSVIAPNGLVCTVYLESNGSTTANKYVIADSTTGQNIVAPTAIPVSSGTVAGGMRVFYLGTNFIIVFSNTISGTTHLQYIAVSAANPTIVTANADLAASYVAASRLAWDCVVVGSQLFFAYSTTAGGQSVATNYLTNIFHLGTPVTYSTQQAVVLSMTADVSNPNAPVIYAAYYNSIAGSSRILAFNTSLVTIMTPTNFASLAFLNISLAAQNGICAIFGELANTYAYDGGISTNFINGYTATPPGSPGVGTIASKGAVLRSTGLASKAFIINGVIYFLAAYQSPYQPTYFLINGSLTSAAAPVIVAKIAYENGGGYLGTGMPSVSVNGTTARVPYLFKDLIEAVNKNTTVPAVSHVAGIYSQTGINLGSFTIGSQNLDTAEIGNDLLLTGGFLWMYDGYLPVEQNFLVYPDSVEATTAGTGGTLPADTYYYQATYEWTDNQGNAYRSAPSIPVALTTMGSTSVNTVYVPTLRLTYKTANPVKLVVYRWSVTQPVYYQFTSITAPTLNDPTIDYIAFTDNNSNASILGNNILYTTGGVVEDTSGPASNLVTLFDTRLWMVDAEDPNLLWFSKQVIEATPVEMSDLLTMYVPPTTAAQGSTGPITALSVMDDKLIIFKQNAIYYINGSGPDNTGANSQYSEATFITSTVGCANQQSIVFTPDGLMFQSDKGIWLLSRGLMASYIGAPVEQFNAGIVKSAQNIPQTNQVRFILSTGVTLMYDYYYGQWGTFVNVPAISSCLFQGLHTYINAYGAVYQETPGIYLDGSAPVLMQFTTGPLRLENLQSYQRAYFFYLMGDYISPHKLAVSVSYDYSPNPSHSVIISPTNYAPSYGSGTSSSPYGQGNPYGGPAVLEDWRVFLKQQRCSAFAISLQEIFDASFGTTAGAGLTLSGINVVCGFKKQFRPISNAHSVG